MEFLYYQTNQIRVFNVKNTNKVTITNLEYRESHVNDAHVNHFVRLTLRGACKFDIYSKILHLCFYRMYY